MNKETLTDGQKIQAVLDELQITANHLSKKLDYKSPAAIYHVLEGRNSLSVGMMEKIITKFSNVNFSFLKTGEGKILLSESEMQNQMNFFNIASATKENPLQAFADIPSKLDELIQLQAEGNELLREFLKKK